MSGKSPNNAKFSARLDPITEETQRDIDREDPVVRASKRSEHLAATAKKQNQKMEHL